MKRITFSLVAVAVLAGVVAFTAPVSGRADQDAAPVFVTKIPPGFRDWRLVSVAHEAGNLNDLRAVLGNDAAIKAYRDGQLPFPDGAIIAGSPGATSRPRKTTKCSGVPNPSCPALPRLPIFSSWLKILRSTPPAAAGVTLNSIKTESLPERHCSKPAFPATSLTKVATMSSPVTHLNTEAKSRVSSSIAA
jgi:hypothetical protein